MEIYEITGLATGVSNSGVNYLEPIDSFQNMEDGFVYRQVLQSRRGIKPFAPRLENGERIFGIFEHILPNGTVKSIIIDKNNLYVYNTTTGVYDKKNFGGSIAAYTGFNIASKENYISGVSYGIAQQISGGAVNPEYTNPGGRFVFCGKGITTPIGANSTIFFYDDANNDVRLFTNTSDNPNYAAPPEGALSSARFVTQFSNRILFTAPTINSVEYAQGFVYSGFANISGNGDKFNVAGSGLRILDTSQSIKGVSVLGNVLAYNLDRSNWILEKTQDGFNPIFYRQVPGVLGTDAPFSPVSWNEVVKSIGRTGVIGTDNRQSLRVDNKVPNFTEDEIDQPKFDYTYGGFDRTNSQFLWAYVSSGSEQLTQNKVLAQNYLFDTWTVFNMRLSCFGQTDLGRNLPWNQIDETAVPENPSWAAWNTTEDIWNKIGQEASVQKTLAGDDLGFVYELNADNDDILTDITAVTPGATTTLTIGAANFAVGDEVCIQNVGGMIELNNFDPETDPTILDPITNILTVTSPTEIVLNVNSTNYTTYTSGGTISKVIKFTADTIPFNPYRGQGRRCYVGYIEFLLNAGSFLYVDVFEDLDDDPIISNILLQPTSLQKASQWVSMSVDNEAEFMTFRLRMTSPAVQFKLTSMRIHAKPGGLTGN